MLTHYARRLETIGRVVSVVALGASGLVFLLAPVSRVQSLGPLFGAIQANYVAAMGACLIAAAFCFAFSESLGQLRSKRARPVEKPERRSAPAKSLVYGLFFLAALFFGRAIYQAITTPFEPDEIVILIQFKSKIRWVDSSLFSPYSHTLATFSASVMHSFFGNSPFWLRLPSVIFSGVLASILLFMSLRFLSPFAGVLMFLHLLCNENLTWFAHSLRGYASFCMAGAALLAMFWVNWDRPRTLTRRKLALAGLAAAFFFPLFTHGYGAIFSISALLGFNTWLYWNRESISKPQLENGITMLLTCLAIVPVLLLTMYCQSRNVIPGLFAAPTDSLPDAMIPGFMAFIGVGRTYYVRLGLLLLAGLTLTAMRKETKAGFLFCFLAAFAAIEWVLLSTSIPRPTARYVLPFVLPLVLWFGERISELAHRRWRGLAVAGALCVFALAPAQAQREVQRIDHQFAAYQSFLERVKEATAGTAPECISCQAEDERLLIWTDHIFFPGCARPEPAAACLRKFHLGMASWRPTVPARQLSSAAGKIVYSDHAGNILYEKF